MIRRAAASAGGSERRSRQFASFEAAMKLFHARNLKEARELFAQAIAGPERDVAQRAQLHIAMCDRRLQQSRVGLRYGGGLLQLRRGPDQRAQSAGGAHASGEGAARCRPASDHIHYALALAQALAGDLAGAHEQSEARHRTGAAQPHQSPRQDADFAPLANQPPFDALLYPGEEELVSGRGRAAPHMEDESPLRVVAIGGGTGSSALLQGLKRYAGAGPNGPAVDITAIVTVTDDGGSSGRLRREFDVLPPGDIRNCMVALSEDAALLSRLFQYRFAVGRGLKGHSFGNLFLTALTHIMGDFPDAVQRLLGSAEDRRPNLSRPPRPTWRWRRRSPTARKWRAKRASAAAGSPSAACACVPRTAPPLAGDARRDRRGRRHHAWAPDRCSPA